MQIGPHRVWSEEDLLVIVVNGTIDGEQARAMNELSLPLFRTYGYVLSLVDARAATGLTPEARRVGAEFRRQHPMPSANAPFGVSLPLRALAFLVYRGLALLRPEPQEMKMFEAEADARLWLAQQRTKLRSRDQISAL